MCLMTVEQDTLDESGITFHATTNTDHDGGSESRRVVTKKAPASLDVYAPEDKTSC